MNRLPPGILRHPLHSLALGFGLGAIPFAPGTFGTLLGVPIYLGLQFLPLSYYLIIVALLFYVGVVACGATAQILGAEDPSPVVFDEVVGYLIAMTAAPAGWQWAVAGFVLFRLFDIWKPWPIRLLERQVRGGLGIMVDDALAAGYTWLVLRVAARVVA